MVLLAGVLNEEVSPLIIALAIVIEGNTTKKSLVFNVKIAISLVFAIFVKIIRNGSLVQFLAALFVVVLHLVSQTGVNCRRVEWSCAETIAVIHYIGYLSEWASKDQTFLIEGNGTALNA